MAEIDLCIQVVRWLSLSFSSEYTLLYLSALHSVHLQIKIFPEEPSVGGLKKQLFYWWEIQSNIIGSSHQGSS